MHVLAGQARRSMAIASLVLTFSGSAAHAAGDLVISQVYGGGGNTGAPYTHDFVELFNRGSNPVSLAGKSIQYASATGTGNLGASGTQLTELPAVTLQPGQYYLVQQGGGTTGAALPAPDLVDPTPIAMAGSAGKVALVNGTTTLGCNGGSAPCSTAQLALIIDLVGYGGANFFENAPTPALSNTTAALRASGGCTDTDVNNADFTVGAPAPRNTATPPNPCGGGVDAPIVASCPANLATTAGIAASAAVSANDADDVVTGATITSAAVAGITLESIAQGNPLTASLQVASTLAAGNYSVVITFSNGDAPAQTSQCTVAVNVAPPLPSPRIREIQGAAHLSPFNGQAVGNVPGIVTARRNNGFWIQDSEPDANVATSEGLFVFTSSAPTVQVGDAVLVSGTVSEFRAGGGGGLLNLTLTQITRPTVRVQSSGNALPPAVVLGAGGRPIPTTVIDDDSAISIDVETAGTFDAANDGLDFLESLEGMRVQVNAPVATGPRNGFGEISVLADGGAGASVRTPRGGIVIRDGDFNPERLILDDVIAATPVVDTGDALSSVAAVVDYSFGNYKLYPTASPTVIADNGPPRESTALTGTADRLTIASYNVENLDADDPAQRFTAIAAQIVGPLGTPDIVALTEVQDDNGPTNDGTVDADQTAAKLIAAIRAAGGPAYQYRDIDPVNNEDGGEPGGNIRQAFLFNPARVTFVDRAGGTATAATTVTSVGGGAELSFSPGRIDPTAAAWASSRKPLAAEFVFNHRKLILIANHFNSKGGDDPLYGRIQPPVRSSEMQRAAQADAVGDFVQAIRTVDPSARVVVLGDLNDFQFSGTMSLLKSGSGLVNLVDTLPEGERYTYVFDGNSQALDHVLVSPALAANAAPQIDIVHVNSEYADQISDHDPVVVSLSIPAPTLANVTGFFAPVDPPASGFNRVNSGQTVPLKFYVATPSGTPLTNLTTVNLQIVPVACAATSADAGDVADADASGVTLENLGGGYYQYNWKTAKADTGCRRVTLALPEPAYLTLSKPAALFQFRR